MKLFINITRLTLAWHVGGERFDINVQGLVMRMRCCLLKGKDSICHYLCTGSCKKERHLCNHLSEACWGEESLL